mmetsp:Transcript_53340/g.121587  ORF Transcript_53340/g.121587 Transcript_53340/m.121587 type:complete len:372 (-) Transcript_53340:414-1529(-)
MLRNWRRGLYLGFLGIALALSRGFKRTPLFEAFPRAPLPLGFGLLGGLGVGFLLRLGPCVRVELGGVLDRPLADPLGPAELATHAIGRLARAARKAPPAPATAELLGQPPLRVGRQRSVGVVFSVRRELRQVSLALLEPPPGLAPCLPLAAALAAAAMLAVRCGFTVVAFLHGGLLALRPGRGLVHHHQPLHLRGVGRWALVQTVKNISLAAPPLPSSCLPSRSVWGVGRSRGGRQGPRHSPPPPPLLLHRLGRTGRAGAGRLGRPGRLRSPGRGSSGPPPAAHGRSHGATRRPRRRLATGRAPGRRARPRLESYPARPSTRPRPAATPTRFVCRPCSSCSRPSSRPRQPPRPRRPRPGARPPPRCPPSAP